jgi:hypothetical protein
LRRPPIRSSSTLRRAWARSAFKSPSSSGSPRRREEVPIRFFAIAELKNPDPGTEEFNAEVQGVIDAMAQVFVEAVARNRGVATETVLNNFGKGGTFVGQMAIEAGLADSIGTFEGTLAELSATAVGRRFNRTRE